MNEATELELQRTLGRLEAAVDGLTREVRESNHANTTIVAQLEHRVTSLERWRVYVAAFGLGAGATIGVLFTALWRVLSIH